MNTVEITIYTMIFIYLIIMSIEDIRKKSINMIPGVICAILCISGMLYLEKSIRYIISGLLVGMILYIISKLSRRSIGEADALVYAIIGVTVGVYETIEILLISLTIASAVAGTLLVVHKVGRRYKIPFIPFTALSYTVVWIYGILS